MSPPDNAGPPAVALPEDDADDLDDEDAKVEAEAADANVEMWESALYASVDRSFNDLVSYAVSTENILAWTKPQYKVGLLFVLLILAAVCIAVSELHFYFSTDVRV